MEGTVRGVDARTVLWAGARLEGRWCGRQQSRACSGSGLPRPSSSASPAASGGPCRAPQHPPASVGRSLSPPPGVGATSTGFFPTPILASRLPPAAPLDLARWLVTGSCCGSRGEGCEPWGGDLESGLTVGGLCLGLELGISDHRGFLLWSQ